MSNGLRSPVFMSPMWRLIWLGVLQVVVYVAVAVLSQQDQIETASIPIVVGLFGLAFALYLFSIAIVTAAHRPQAITPPDDTPSDGWWPIVLGFGIAFRLILWWSQPILEVDLYRYLWDGRVLTAGVNPYRFSPEELSHQLTRAEPPGTLHQLAGVYNESPATREILDRVHFPEVPTVYPPVSQLVFAATAWCIPVDASVSVHLLMMKCVLILFDLATVLLVARILTCLKLPPSQALVYAWCPLVMKEIANSGHLDSIAVCLTVLALWLQVRSPFGTEIQEREGRAKTIARSSGIAALWAVATLAKFFPLVVLPLLVRWWWRSIGWLVVVPLATFAMVISAVYFPFTRPAQVSIPGNAEFETAGSRDPLEGMRTFMTGWEMNDLVFAVAVGNLDLPPADAPRPVPALASPNDESAGYVAPWYAVAPVSWRTWVLRIAGRAIEYFGIDAETLDVPFLTTQFVMASILVFICVWLAVSPWQGDIRITMLRRTFYCLAWCWFLSATQNPWYWTWALPLVVFVRGPWLAVSGAALLYYLRFWFDARFAGHSVWGTPYVGADFFDHVVVWFEHLPILVWLGWRTLMGAWKRRIGPRCSSHSL